MASILRGNRVQTSHVLCDCASGHYHNEGPCARHVAHGCPLQQEDDGSLRLASDPVDRPRLGDPGNQLHQGRQGRRRVAV